MKSLVSANRRCPWLTPRAKLVSVVVLVTLISVVTLSMVHFLSTRVREQQVAINHLDMVAQRYSESIQGIFGEMTEDAALLAEIPPIQGIIRASEEKSGRDLEDGSSLEQWRNRLETIFTSLLITRPHYSQLRFIGRADHWRELVRVNQTEMGREKVGVRDLQQKGDEPYLRSLSTKTSMTTPYFSEVTLNREHRKVEGAATIRIVVPVLDEGGEIFGAIVINADFASLLHHAAPNVIDGIRATAVTSALDYMTFSAQSKAPELVFHADATWVNRSSFAFLFQQAKHNQIIFVEEEAETRADGYGEELAIYIHEVEAASADHPFALYLITEMHKSDLFAEVKKRLEKDLFLSVLLILLSFLLALGVGNHLTRPLSELHKFITARHEGAGLSAQTIRPCDEVGELAAAFSNMSDELMRETQRVHAMFSAVGNAVVVIDENGIIEEFNPAAEEIFGYRQDEVVGQNVGRLMPKEIAKAHQSYIANLGKSSRKMGADREIVGVRKDGRLVPLEISVSGVSYSGSHHMIGFVRDITDRKAAETRVQDLIAALERSNEELDQFAYVASHDLKAPLRVIDNASQWLEEDLEEYLTEDTRESMALLRSRVGRMERLLDDLLAHSRIGRVPTKTDEIRGDWLLDGIKELLDMPEGFSLHVSEAFANIDVLRMPLEPVLLNLISNAIKHHDRVQGRVEIDVVETDTEYEFVITDDGPGIPPKYHQKVFELFQTLKPRDQIEASGMGLAMVRKYVDLVGGRIHILSGDGRGTTFRLSWPKGPADAQNMRKLAS
ncbi:sensor histidine kinase [Celeribacter sp. ULVN23_4]